MTLVLRFLHLHFLSVDFSRNLFIICICHWVLVCLMRCTSTSERNGNQNKHRRKSKEKKWNGEKKKSLRIIANNFFLLFAHLITSAVIRSCCLCRILFDRRKFEQWYIFAKRLQINNSWCEIVPIIPIHAYPMIMAINFQLSNEAKKKE